MQKQEFVNVITNKSLPLKEADKLLKSKTMCFNKALKCEADGERTEAIDKWLNKAIGYENQLVSL